MGKPFCFISFFYSFLNNKNGTPFILFKIKEKREMHMRSMEREEKCYGLCIFLLINYNACNIWDGFILF